MPLPNEADPKQLSMISVNPPTAALLLSDFATLQAGDWVIQNTANSGVGGYLVQLAKLKGIRTVNVVRRESAVAGVLAQGGDVVLVDGDDLAARVKEATSGAAIRLAVDAVGGMGTERVASCLSEGGAVVNYGAQHITSGKLNAPIHATYPVSRIKEAVIAAHTGGRDGKVLVAPDS